MTWKAAIIINISWISFIQNFKLKFWIQIFVIYFPPFFSIQIQILKSKIQCWNAFFFFFLLYMLYILHTYSKKLKKNQVKFWLCLFYFLSWYQRPSALKLLIISRCSSFPSLATWPLPSLYQPSISCPSHLSNSLATTIYYRRHNVFLCSEVIIWLGWSIEVTFTHHDTFLLKQWHIRYHWWHLKPLL